MVEMSPGADDATAEDDTEPFDVEIPASVLEDTDENEYLSVHDLKRLREFRDLCTEYEATHAHADARTQRTFRANAAIDSNGSRLPWLLVPMKIHKSGKYAGEKCRETEVYKPRRHNGGVYFDLDSRYANALYFARMDGHDSLSAAIAYLEEKFADDPYYPGDDEYTNRGGRGEEPEGDAPDEDAHAAVAPAEPDPFERDTLQDVARRVATGDRHPDAYADAKAQFSDAVARTQPVFEASRGQMLGAIRDYSRWFLQNTPFLNVPHHCHVWEISARAKRAQGRCRYKNDEAGAKFARVEIKEDHARRGQQGRFSGAEKWAKVCETIRHELIHAHLYLNGFPAGHTRRFQWLGRIHSVRVDRYGDGEQARYWYGCPECGWRGWKQRNCATIKRSMHPDRGTCKKCGGRTKGGEVDPEKTLSPREGGPDGLPADLSTEVPEPQTPAPTPEVGNSEPSCSECGGRAPTSLYGDTLIAWCEDCGHSEEI